MDAARTIARRSRSATGGSSRSVTTMRCATGSGRGRGSSSCAGRSVTPGLRRCARPSGAGRRRPTSLRSAQRARHSTTYLGDRRAPTRPRTRTTWIRGDGWSMADFPGGVPHRADLDRVVPDRPVYLDSRDGHTAWVNSQGARAGRRSPPTRPTPTTAGSSATPTAGHPARSRRARSTSSPASCPPTRPTSSSRALRLAQADLHALGITNWQDANVIAEAGEVAYTTARRSRRADGRVVGALWWDRARGAEQIEELVERRARTAIGRLRPDQRQDDPGRRPRERGPAPSSSRTSTTTAGRRRTAA